MGHIFQLLRILRVEGHTKMIETRVLDVDFRAGKCLEKCDTLASKIPTLSQCCDCNNAEIAADRPAITRYLRE